MKKSRILAAGIAVGMVFTMSLQVFAAPAIEKIQAYVNHQMTFEFDGVKKALPTGYEVLVYNDRSYVPAKFVAENLGAEVDWNDSTKVISIKSGKQEGTVTPPAVTVTPPAVTPEEKDDYDYKAMPQTKESEDIRLSVVSYFKDSDGVEKLSISMKNKGKGTITYDQMAATFKVEGKTYATKGEDAVNMDGRLYKSLEEDQDIDGFIPIPKDLKKHEKMHIELTVNVTKDYKTTPEKFSFDVKL